MTHRNGVAIAATITAAAIVAFSLIRADDSDDRSTPIASPTTDKNREEVQPVVREADAPATARDAVVPVELAPRAMPRPVRPNLDKLQGSARINALRAFREQRRLWLARHGKQRKAKAAQRWASVLLGDPRILSVELDEEQRKALQDLQFGIRAEIGVVRRAMRVASDPIFARRLEQGRFVERALEDGHPLPVVGIIHRYGIYPSRHDASKCVRRVVSILPGESAELDRLRAEEYRVTQIAKQSLREQARTWKQ